MPRGIGQTAPGGGCTSCTFRRVPKYERVVLACSVDARCTRGVPAVVLGDLPCARAELPASAAPDRLGWADPPVGVPTSRVAAQPGRVDWTESSVGKRVGLAPLGARVPAGLDARLGGACGALDGAPGRARAGAPHLASIINAESQHHKSVDSGTKQDSINQEAFSEYVLSCFPQNPAAPQKYNTLSLSFVDSRGFPQICADSRGFPWHGRYQKVCAELFILHFLSLWICDVDVLNF